VKGQHLHQPDLGTFPLAASPEVLPVHHRDLPQVRPRKDLEEASWSFSGSRRCRRRVRVVCEDGVARGLAQAEVG
jgi:hypothetical protein